MIFNEDVIRRKEIVLKKMSLMTLDEIERHLCQLFGSVQNVCMIALPWYPGGGSVLLNAKIDNEVVFIKIKDKTLTVESRLECEQDFSKTGALKNEAMFCKLLADDPNVPKLKFYKEDAEYAYAVFEKLIPFEEGIKHLDAYERYQTFCDLEKLLRRLFANDIVHTDVHEKNILFRGKQPVLCDFEEARYLHQDLPFEQSLDLVGENLYGNVGYFPEGYGIKGLSCLARLRQVFKPLIKEVFSELLEKCHFSNDCLFNADELQEKDERIYQSVDFGDSYYRGQRPLYDQREGILVRFLSVLTEQLGNNLHVVDVGSNLGMLSFAAANCAAVKKVIGLEAFPEYVQAAEILGFLFDQHKVSFFQNQVGVDLMPNEPIDVLLLFSVYHHINNKDAFLQEMMKNRPRSIIAEMAVEERYYQQRNGLVNELQHIRKILGYKTFQIIGITPDYKRPICLLSDEPAFDQSILDYIMGVNSLKSFDYLALSNPSASPKFLRKGPVKVSIVLPTYNHLKYLPSAIQSILNQTFEDFELIIINDGSTDLTEAFLSNIENSNIHVINQNNQGISNALNNGFALAQGEYWTWTSADNIVGPTWLEELVKALDTSPSEIGYAFSLYACIDENGKILQVEHQCFDTYRLLLRCGIASFLYKSEVAKKVGLYDPTLHGAEDLDMWIRMSQVTRAIHVDSVLYYYRWHANTLTKKIPEVVLSSTRRVILKYMNSTGGKLDIDRLFPEIKESTNPVFARWQAKIWLANKIALSPFFMLEPGFDLLTEAIHEKYDPRLIGNLVFLCAEKKAWEKAAEVVESCLQKDNSEYFQILATIIRRKDMNILTKVPMIVFDDQDLVFNITKQLSMPCQ